MPIRGEVWEIRFYRPASRRKMPSQMPIANLRPLVQMARLWKTRTIPTTVSIRSVLGTDQDLVRRTPDTVAAAVVVPGCSLVFY